MYRQYLFYSCVFVALMLALVSCGSGISSSSPLLPTATVVAEAVQATPIPVPLTPALPTRVESEHQGNDEYGYCIGIPEPVRLLISEAEGLSKDEIAEKMMRLRLDSFSSSKISDYCRIEKYRIDKISEPEPWMLDNVSLPPRSFLRVVDFSIKLPQFAEYWFRFVSTGEIDLPDGYAGAFDNPNWLRASMVLVVYEKDPGGDGIGGFYGAAQVKINP